MHHNTIKEGFLTPTTHNFMPLSSRYKVHVVNNTFIIVALDWKKLLAIILRELPLMKVDEPRQLQSGHALMCG